MPPSTTARPDNDPLDRAAQALFAFARLFNRMPRRDAAAPGHGAGSEVGLIALAQAVANHGANPDPVTVGTVAAALALDPSTASRLVARGVERGYLRRHPAPDDGRVVALSLTPAGERLVLDAARYQRSVFDAATLGWTPADRETFARLFVQFTGTVAEMVIEQAAPTPREETL